MRQWRPGTPISCSARPSRSRCDIILQAVFGIADPARWRATRRRWSRRSALTPALLFVKALQHRASAASGRGRGCSGARAPSSRCFYDEMAAPPRRARGARGRDQRRDGGALRRWRADDRRQLYATLYDDRGRRPRDVRDGRRRGRCYFVPRDPAVRERLLAELASLVTDADPAPSRGLPFLEAVCRRDAAAAPHRGRVARTLKRPMRLGAWSLPAGVAVSPSIMVCIAVPSCIRSGGFRPERFLNRTRAVRVHAVRRRPPPLHRRGLRVVELKIVLATLLRRERPLRLDHRPAGGRATAQHGSRRRAADSSSRSA